MTTGEPLITDHLRAQLGRDAPPVTLEVEKAGIRMFARAVGYTDPVYYDEDEARRRGHRALPAPPGFVGTPRFRPGADPLLARPARSLHPDLTRGLDGGTEWEYTDTVYAGDVLTATTRFVDLQEREGRLGRMLISVRETVYRRDGRVVARSRRTSISY